MRRMRLKTLLLTVVALTMTALNANAALTVNWNASTKTLTLGGSEAVYSTTWTENNDLKSISKTDVKAAIIGENVELHTDAFNGCTALETVTFAEGYTKTSIGYYCFKGCTALKSITLPSSVTSIGQEAFSGCSSLESVTLPSGITQIQNYTFYNCSSLKSITIPSGVTVIGVNSLAYCTSLESITLPSSVTSIYMNAFQQSTNLRYIDLSATSLTSLAVQRSTSSTSFNGVAESTIIYMPAGSSATGTNVVVGTTCSALTLDATNGTAVPHDFTANAVTYARSLAADNSYTVCLPYAPPTRDGLTYYELNKVDGSTLDFTEVATPAANTPYLVVTTKAVADFSTSTSTELKATPDEIAVAKNGYKLVGTLTTLSEDETTGKYILQAGNKWQKTDAKITGVNIPAFRAYIVSTGGGAPQLSMTLDGEGTTAIENIRTISQDGTEQWYDLSGRRIAAPAKKGIYIINGKKVVR